VYNVYEPLWLYKNWLCLFVNALGFNPLGSSKSFRNWNVIGVGKDVSTKRSESIQALAPLNSFLYIFNLSATVS